MLAPSPRKSKEKTFFVRDTLTHPAKGLCPSAHPLQTRMVRLGPRSFRATSDGRKSSRFLATPSLAFLVWRIQGGCLEPVCLHRRGATPSRHDHGAWIRPNSSQTAYSPGHLAKLRTTEGSAYACVREPRTFSTRLQSGKKVRFRGDTLTRQAIPQVQDRLRGAPPMRTRFQIGVVRVTHGVFLKIQQ